MRTGILIGYFASDEDARKALRRLRMRGYWRAARVAKDAQGKVRVRDPFVHRRGLGAGAAWLLAGLLATLALSIGLVPILRTGLNELLTFGAGGIFGCLGFLAVMRRSRYGIDRHVLSDQIRWLLPSESVVIVQGAVESLELPAKILVEGEEVQPAVFVVYPKREPATSDRGPRASAITGSSLKEHAEQLAATHSTTPMPRGNLLLLRRIERGRRWIHDVCLDLGVAHSLEQIVSPAAEWLLDNEYIVEGTSRKIILNLPRRYYQQLPALAGRTADALPRIYALARELAGQAHYRLDQDNILAFLSAYQNVSPLSIGELWAVPQMLRAALLDAIRAIAGRTQSDLRERGLAHIWANRLIAVNRRDPSRLFAILADLTQSTPTPYFASQLIDYLYDEEAALTPVQRWFERTFQRPLPEIINRENARQTNDQIGIGDAFTSLRMLDLLDWKICFEQLSSVDNVLRQDPAGVYARMDFVTRDRCRRAVEDLHRGSGLAEVVVAQRALAVAGGAADEAAKDERAIHVGTYLIGDGRRGLAQMIGCHETYRFRTLRWLYRHHTPVYFGGFAAASAGLLLLIVATVVPGVPLGLAGLVAFFAAIPASQIALDMLNYLVIRFLPPRILPKMDYTLSGIPDAYRTLVVVPVMLTDGAAIQEDAERLEIRYLANKEHNLLFGLFSDYADATSRHTEEDSALLQQARGCIEALNARYGGDRFLLFHRDREWSDSEQRFIGWERKRGKLEELNGLLAGTRLPDAVSLIHAGDPEQVADIRFVITLDSDTQLPSGTARRLIETLSHPLNRPRLNGAGRVLDGYTIIQPRVTASLPSVMNSPFSRLFSDPVGLDPYTNAVSDVHQDLCGEGSYHGKGIYDVRAFNRVIGGRFPEGRLLSHDLIEGAHVRVALASDIELYDEFPQDYLSFMKRQHRWIRGDWQIAQWVLPSVPRRGGGGAPNALSLFNRGKIFDNLRRSLLPVASLGLLATCWSISPEAGSVATAVVSVQLLFHSLAQPFTWATTPRGSKGISMARVVHDLLRVAAEAALLPSQAWLAVDAIGRALYRTLVSRRGMLEWTSARVASVQSLAGSPVFLLSMCLVSAVSLLVAWHLSDAGMVSLALGSPWLFLWFVSPGVGWLLNRRPEARQPRTLLRKADSQFLRMVAFRTWRYFSDFVNEKTSWLPPDNYQVAYQNQLAMRTSPTNIGLWMVSVLGAHEFGYLTVDGVTQSLTRTLGTLGRLDRHEGHLMNWYDIATLTPLKPGYVSTVDSGNLLGALWAVERGISRILRAPVFDAKCFHGLQDAGESVRLAVEGGNGPTVGMQPLFDAMKAWEVPPESLADSLPLLRGGRERLRSLVGATAAGDVVTANVTALTGKVSEQMDSWGNIADRYLGWVDILGERSTAAIAYLDPRAVPLFQHALRSAPSLEDLASGNLPWIPFLREIRERAANVDIPTAEWADRVFASLDRSKWFAGEMLASAMKLLRDLRELSDSMRMRFLYDAGRRLFSIGFNVAEGRLDRAYYDLLASEARLGSFVAIARGEIPVEHWFAMNRPYGIVGRRTVLLSWTGTMFEYLMPLLFLRSYANSLLDKAVREAVAVQIGYGHIHRVPWGISESASGDLDVHKTYQYNAYGVPLLGLKRGLADKTVIAPYATLLAVNVDPRESLRNLRKLAALGLLGDYGYYDAIDFSQQPTREGGRGVIVQTYMAHHQGMGFLALVNLLHGNSIQNHFHDDPRVRAVEPLLHERIPHLPLLNEISTRARISSVAAIGEVAPSVSHFDNPHTPSPKTQILSNGRYSLMLTNAGGGYTRWGDADLTRWRSDRTRDSWGTFCYIHDADAGRLWCNTYQPTGGKVEGYNAEFSLDRAVFRRVDSGIQCDTEIIVAPDDDAEIRRMTLVNRTLRMSRLDITSYLELSLAPHNTDRQHPAFNKLFIETEAVPERRALLGFRRPRHDTDPQVYIGHRFTLEEESQEPLQFETERARFVGRGQTLVRPLGAVHVPGNSQGFVLDPILSIRQTVALEAGQRIQLSMITVAAGNREDALRLLERYSSPRTIDRAMDSAWTSSQLELHLLRIQPDDARRFQQVASHLLYPNPLLRAPADRIAENRKGQAALWAYGISGDLPIALIVIGELEDLSLVRQMLKAHHYWRLHGLSVDLVVLNEEAVGYDRPLHEQLERLLHAHAGKEGLDRPGGIYLRSMSAIPQEDLTLLRAVARTVMVAARGNLPQQLGAPSDAPEPYGHVSTRRISRDRSAALPFMELSYFNSIGGFTPDGLEYAIYLGPGMHTPMPWVNVIANPSFGTVISETGAGFTWQGNSQRNRLTEWSNDPVIDPPSEAIYIRDEETGTFWTPTAMPIREDSAYRARFGAGYGVFEHNSHGIEQELTVFVPLDENGGEPIKLQRLLLKNDSGRTRQLSVTYYVEWTLGESREASQDQIVTAWDDEVESITARNHYHPDYGDRHAFAAISTPTDSHTADRTSFLGRNRSMQNPVAMERDALSRRTGASLDPCAALRTTIRLAEGEQVEITCMLGQTKSLQEARSLILTYRSGPTVNAALGQAKLWWSNRLGMVQVRTPDLAIDLLVNRWLLYQTLSCRVWGRSAFYQSGGAFGFRDQLQDVMALLYAHPDLARQHILRAASRQFVEGDVQHWWHMPRGEGIRSRISDDLLWLPFVVAQYVRITGDETLLAESVNFIEALPLEDAERERFQNPNISSEVGTIFEHCRRATARGARYGSHGLPLMGTGDWNDGMNLVGAGGKGESVWLAWFLVDVLKGMEELSDIVGRADQSVIYRRDSAALRESIEGFAWDGEWYLRATFDDGTLLGASAGREGRIDSLPQSWAWLCGAAQPERAVTALESAWRHLVRQEEGLVLLFEPPFDTMHPSPGYIKGYPPGVRENGGQYTHAAVWFAMAMARRGDGTRAATIMGLLNPIEHARDQDAVWRYGIEPYAVAGDIYRLPDRIGKGGWSWYTGSSAWMYRCWVEEIMGLHVRGNSLSVAPVIPGWWDGFDMAYRHAEAIYEIRVDNPDHVESGVAWVEMDGKRLASNSIPLSREFVKHRISVRMGGSPSPGAQ